MKLLVFTVFDSATEAYIRPFFVRSVGEAVRMFTESVNSEGHDFAKHADDFTLFQIGEYDDNTGSLTPMTPFSFGNALEYRRPMVRGRGPQLDIEDALKDGSDA